MAGYHQAFACVNGHKIAKRTFNNAEVGASHCPTCGGEAFGACPEPECGAQLRADAVPTSIKGRKNASADDLSWELASYCYKCGKPYPWTEVRAAAAEELLDELDELDHVEREQLKAGIRDLIVETPASGVAVLRWKRAIQKLSGPGQQIVSKVLSDVASASVKAMLGL